MSHRFAYAALREGIGRRLGLLPHAPSAEAAAQDAGWTLWRKACAGDASCATQLVRQLAPQAHSLAWHIVRHTEDAQDMVQESFLRLWGSHPSASQGAALSTYFNTIVINRCKSFLVRRREFDNASDRLVDLSDAQQIAAGTHCDTPADHYDAHRSAARVRAAVGALPARQRMALAMWAYTDADAAAIARALEIETNAAHQLLHRAKAALRLQLQGASS